MCDCVYYGAHVRWRHRRRGLHNDGVPGCDLAASTAQRVAPPKADTGCATAAAPAGLPLRLGNDQPCGCARSLDSDRSHPRGAWPERHADLPARGLFGARGVRSGARSHRRLGRGGRGWWGVLHLSSGAVCLRDGGRAAGGALVDRARAERQGLGAHLLARRAARLVPGHCAGKHQLSARLDPRRRHLYARRVCGGRGRGVRCDDAPARRRVDRARAAVCAAARHVAHHRQRRLYGFRRGVDWHRRRRRGARPARVAGARGGADRRLTLGSADAADRGGDAVPGGRRAAARVPWRRGLPKV